MLSGLECNCVIIVLVLLLIVYFSMRGEGFSTKDQAGEIYEKTKSMFSGEPTYKEYQKKVSNADIVDYYKLKGLSNKGEFTVKNIEKSLT